MAADPRAVIARLIAYGPEEIERGGYKVNTGRCLASTRVGLDVLAYFGVEAEPVPVNMVALNAAMLPLFEAAKRRKVTVEEMDEVGAWCVATDTENEHPRLDGKPGWPGHMVIGVPSLGSIVDLDVIQFSRPEKRIFLPRAAAFDVPPGFWDGSDEADFVLDEGGLLAYQRIEPKQPYIHASDWRKRHRHKPIAGALIRRIRAEVNGGA